MDIQTLEQMAKSAVPTSDDDWGSERQIEAQNAFFEACDKVGLPTEHLYATAKMSVEDMVEDALKRIRDGEADQHRADAARISESFSKIYSAAMVINEVLGRNDALNDSVPTDWPLNLSADEFAAECQAMSWHYEALAKRAN